MSSIRVIIPDVVMMLEVMDVGVGGGPEAPTEEFTLVLERSRSESGCLT